MNRIPMNLQIFAESGDPAGAPPTGQAPAATPQSNTAIDYDKIAQLIQGKRTVSDDSVLKGYFKQQGLSQDEMTQAINAFKQQQAAQQPDVAGLQTQAAQAQALAQQKDIENKAILEAIQLGIDAKTVPYVLKLADLSNVAGTDGTINQESLKAALNKVLEEVPALKPAPGHSTGFKQIGATGGTNQTTSDDALKAAFGL